MNTRISFFLWYLLWKSVQEAFLYFHISRISATKTSEKTRTNMKVYTVTTSSFGWVFHRFEAICTWKFHQIKVHFWCKICKQLSKSGACTLSFCKCYVTFHVMYDHKSFCDPKYCRVCILPYSNVTGTIWAFLCFEKSIFIVNAKHLFSQTN